MPKEGAALLALLGPKKGGDDMVASDDKPEGNPHAQAAQDFFEAGKKGDWDAAGEALETIVLNCMSDNKGSESEE